jgi:predicted CoA-binding protein
MSPSELLKILTSYREIAVVGISANPDRPSHWIARYLADQGYEVAGVNPGLPRLPGLRVVATLAEAPQPLEIVNVFRASENVPALVEELLPLKPKVLWLQEGAENAEAEARATAAGIQVVSGRCIYRDHHALLGANG